MPDLAALLDQQIAQATAEYHVALGRMQALVKLRLDLQKEPAE